MSTATPRAAGLHARLAATAAAPFERRAGGWLEPLGGDAREVDRLLAARAAVAGGVAELERLLAARGLSQEDGRTEVQAVRVVAGEPVPPWVEALGELLADGLGAVRNRLEVGGAAAPLVDGIVADGELRLRWLAAAAGDGTIAGALDAAPGLARPLGVALQTWTVAATELCERFERDLPELERLLGAGVAPATCHPGAGDPHCGGRTVSIVELTGGRRLVYKPRDARFPDALACLAAPFGLELAARLDRDGYSWEAFVDARGPTGPGELAALARELGAWTRLLDLLGAGDFIGANVRVAGPRVVPVDVETAVGAELAGDAELPAGAKTGLLSSTVVEPGGRGSLDLGLLAHADREELVAEVEEIVAGFAAAQATLVRRRAEVTRLLDAFAGTEARTLLRSTRTYDRVLTQSLRLPAAASGVDRELVLERLWRAWAVGRLPAPLVESEVAALRDLDIPLFRFEPAGRDLVGSDGRIARDVLPEAPLDRIRRRLEKLDAVCDPADADSVRALAFCAAPSVALPLPTAHPAPAPDWAAEAAAAGRELLAFIRTGGPGGRPLAAGIAYLQRARLFALVPLVPADLFSGSAGIALALADLWRLTRDEETARAARREAARGATRHAELVEAAGLGRPRAEGAYWGRAAIAHALAALPPELLPPEAAPVASAAPAPIRWSGPAVRALVPNPAGGGCDLLLRVDESLAAGDRAAGADAASRLLALRRSAGRWFPETPAPDRYRLSAFWGLGGVVRVLARLALAERLI